MSRNGLGPAGLDKLEAALDTYGADRTRWPAPLRLSLSGLIAGNSDARKMLTAAEAFDRLLDSAPQYDTARLGDLSGRIAAAAERQPRLIVKQSRSDDTNRKSRWWPAVQAVRGYHGFAATALAASLVVGVFAGQLNMFNSTADVLLGRDAVTSSPATGQLAQTDDSDGLLDEDLL